MIQPNQTDPNPTLAYLKSYTNIKYITELSLVRPVSLQNMIEKAARCKKINK